MSIEGLGFDPANVPEVWFGGVKSPTVEVISSVLLDVTVPACHDTACAFAAAPVLGPRSAILSSGTWSLVGIELDAPIISEDAMRLNFTNEGGVCGTTRLLKNVMGLWMVQECKREWSS